MTREKILLRPANPDLEEGLAFARYMDQAAGNERTRALYARNGMVESSQWPDVGILRPLFIRMTQPIQRTANESQHPVPLR